MFRKITMVHIYERLQETVSWLQMHNHQLLIAELESIRVVKAGRKVRPLLYDMYDIPREWEQSDNCPVCDMV